MATTRSRRPGDSIHDLVDAGGSLQAMVTHGLAEVRKMWPGFATSAYPFVWNSRVRPETLRNLGEAVGLDAVTAQGGLEERLQLLGDLVVPLGRLGELVPAGSDVRRYRRIQLPGSCANRPFLQASWSEECFERLSIISSGKRRAMAARDFENKSVATLAVSGELTNDLEQGAYDSGFNLSQDRAIRTLGDGCNSIFTLALREGKTIRPAQRLQQRVTGGFTRLSRCRSQRVLLSSTRGYWNVTHAKAANSIPTIRPGATANGKTQHSRLRVGI
ncbi:MAG: hypothetical protein HKL81_05150 [Acidimicrobiaceae bacterium]|nr:hypothetical protein [Acidimicrobiaceae bacterium]